MIFSSVPLPTPRFIRALKRVVMVSCLGLLITVLGWVQLWGMPPALAGINDDSYDGNIFALYGGNSGIVPPRQTLAQALERHKPTLLLFYLDDSSDCKQYAIVVSRLQAFYGRSAAFIAINVDTLPSNATDDPSEPGYYYEGVVPQTLILDRQGKVALNAKGQIPFEQADDVFREVFNLLPRSESVELKVRSFNEFNTELAE